MKKITTFLMIFGFATIAGCSSNYKRSSDTIHIAAVNATCAYNKLGNVRYNALKETATLVGAQGGLAWRSEQINCVLKRQQDLLDQIYNFRSLMLKDDIRPPVLEEGRDELTLDSCETLRASDQIFRIVAPPCFVSAPPNWRDYIWMRFCQPESPDITLMPKCQDEAGIWNCYVNLGWQQGIDQANQIFRENLSRLKRDFNGMLLYRKLLAQNMVTPPYVAKTELGVTGNANELRINDRVLRISATSQLNTNPDTWKPAVPNACPEDCPPRFAQPTPPAITKSVVKCTTIKKKKRPKKKSCN